MRVVRGNSIGFSPASHEDPGNPGCFKRILANHEDFRGGSIQMINWCRIPAGKSFRRHYHESMLEVFIILDGTVQLCGGEFECDLDAGDLAIVEPMEAHSMTNAGERDVHYIVAGIVFDKQGSTVVCDSG